MSFSRKRIDVSFALANGQFAGGGNSHTVSGLRVMCMIESTGGESQSRLQLVIFGLPLSVMNQLSTVGAQIDQIYKNQVTVFAGDDEIGMSMVFQGQIIKAFVEGSAPPNVAFVVLGRPGHFDMVKPVKPISIQGSADAAGMMSQIAGQMGLSFENNGVTAKLANPYYPGTAMSQMMAIARHCGFDAIIDRGVLAIVPPDETRSSGTPLISPQTGMVGYPRFDQASVEVTSYYKPEVRCLGDIQIQSELTPACGIWKVVSITYELESETPGGKWFQTMSCAPMKGNIS